MKNILIKSLSIATIFSMAFSWNVAQAVALDTPIISPEVCESKTLVSKGEENDAVGVDPLHPAWTTIDGASWVWSENPIADPVGQTDKMFSRTFDLTAIPTDATLSIAADNMYQVSLNGSIFITDFNEDNFSSADSHIIDPSAFKVGENTIDFKVTNLPQESGTMENNPAGLIYKLSVNCSEAPVEDPQDCDQNEQGCDNNEEDTPGTCGQVFARFDISKFENMGDGGVSTDSYVGSKLSIVSEGQWFMLYDGTNYVPADASIDTYEDVPGLAVERSDGRIRILLHGSGEPAPNYRELISGSLELYGATVTGVIGDVSGNNILEDGSGDSVKDLISFVGNTANFSLQVDTADDAFYVDYVLDETDCGGPVCTEDCVPVCDTEDCDNPEPTCEELQNCVTETDDTPTDDGNNGGGSSSGSRRSSGGGGNGGGEVLGAETSICSWNVDTYMRKGYKNDPAQVMILQRDLLNGYMNAGVTVDGIYGPSTEAAVMAFQRAKGDKVLKPWYNLFQPTGIFYKTTLVEAKNTICPDAILPIPTDLIDWSKNSAEVPAKI